MYYIHIDQFKKQPTKNEITTIRIIFKTKNRNLKVQNKINQ